MRKGSGELLRVQNVIENDRLNTGGGFNELLVADIGKLLKDYFDFSSDPCVEIIKGKDGYKVSISICASRIKTFNYLLKDK